MTASAEKYCDMLKLLQRIRPFIVALALVAVLATVASACPTCKEGLDQNDPQHQSVAAGFYYSILFMMSMPYIVLGSFGYLAFLSIRKAKVRQEAEAANDQAVVNVDA
jgi:uncharacterized membrane protein